MLATTPTGIFAPDRLAFGELNRVPMMQFEGLSLMTPNELSNTAGFRVDL